MELMLKDMGGRKARQRRMTKQSTLDQVITLAQGYTDPLKTIGFHNAGWRNYADILESVKELEIDEEELTQIIHALGALAVEEEQKKVIGLYSGALLEVLTQRQRERGEPTKFYMNGEGMRFDYLFANAQNIGDVTIDNFTGEYIGCAMLATQGTAGKIAIINCKGERIAWDTGYRGTAEAIYIINCEGNLTGVYTAHQSQVKDLLFANNDCGKGGLSENQCTGNLIALNNTAEINLAPYPHTDGKIILGRNKAKHVMNNPWKYSLALSYASGDRIPPTFTHHSGLTCEGFNGPDAVKRHLELTGVPFGDVVIRAEQMKHNMTAEEIIERADWIMEQYNGTDA